MKWLVLLLCFCFKGVEWTCTSKRSFVSLSALTFFSLGLMVMSGVAYFVRDWRNLHLVFSSPLILLLLAAYWSVNPSVLQCNPETPLTILSISQCLSHFITSHWHFVLHQVISNLLFSWIIYHKERQSHKSNGPLAFEFQLTITFKKIDKKAPQNF